VIMIVRRARSFGLRAPLVLGVLASGCGGPWIPAATPADAARASTTVEELDRGRALLLNRCGACHATPSPRDRAAADWPAQVEEMRARARLSPEDAAAVTRYVVAFARDAGQ
jgi:mono/diheme cytochrome c family protein